MEGEDHTGYIYLLQKRSETFLGENVYKIGSAKMYEKYMNQNKSDKNSTIYTIYKVNHYNDVKQIFLFLFKSYFEKIDMYGKNYFRGDVFKMMKLMDQFFVNYGVYFIEKVSLFLEFKNDHVLHHIIYNDENTNKGFYDYIENIKKIHQIELNKADFREYSNFFEKYIYRPRYNIEYEYYKEEEILQN